MTDPQPPYPVALPTRFADTPYDDLPPGLRRRVDEAANQEGPTP